MGRKDISLAVSLRGGLRVTKVRKNPDSAVQTACIGLHGVSS